MHESKHRATMVPDLQHIAQETNPESLAQLDRSRQTGFAHGGLRGIGRRSSQRCTNHFARPYLIVAIPSKPAASAATAVMPARRRIDRRSAGKARVFEEGDRAKSATERSKDSSISAVSSQFFARHLLSEVSAVIPGFQHSGLPSGSQVRLQ